MNLQLTVASEENISQIQALAVEIWNDNYPEIIGQKQVDYMLSRVYSSENMLVQMRGSQCFLIIVLDLQAVGFLSYEDKGDGIFFIHKFYVGTTLHRKGVGSSVFCLFLDKTIGVREIRLQVNRQNHKAINFYFKLGFVIELVADFDIGDGYFMNDFVMLYRA